VIAAKRFLSRIIAGGKDVVFVGTKRQARSVIEEVGKRTGMPFVAERWLGGTLTNYRTIRSRLQRFEELEAILGSPDVSKNYSKKMEASLKREFRKIKRNLSGIRNMDRLPGVVFVVDVKREIIAIKEARKLGIPVVAVVDTNCDPDQVDYPIAGNDDALRAIRLFSSKIADAVIEGRALATEQEFTAEKIVSDETPLEDIPEYTQYVDPRYSEQLMSESLPDEDLPSSSLPRKGPGSETAGEVAAREENP
jgi:small subunit ribosomal protein S2